MLPHLESKCTLIPELRYGWRKYHRTETAWKVSSFGVAQYLHGYDPALLAAIEEAALKLKASHAVHKHLDLTFITGADRFIPEIKQLLHDKLRLERLSDMMGTKLEPYPLSIVGSTVTFMNPKDGAVEWHCDGVPVTELIPLSISNPLVGGHLEIYCDDSETGRAILESGREIPRNRVMRIDHKMNYATLGQFLGVLHRTAPIRFGERVTLVLNQRSVAKPYVDDNRMFYLAADNDEDRSWVEQLAMDVWTNQLPAYRRFEEKRPVPVSPEAQFQVEPGNGNGHDPEREPVFGRIMVKTEIEPIRSFRMDQARPRWSSLPAQWLWSTNAWSEILLASHPYRSAVLHRSSLVFAHPVVSRKVPASRGGRRSCLCGRLHRSGRHHGAAIHRLRLDAGDRGQSVAYTWPLMVARRSSFWRTRGARHCWGSPRS